MAQWRKVIVSGSAAELSSLTLDTALPVAQGGIGATSLTDKAVLISQDSGTDAVGAVALTSNGQIIIGGSDGPAAATITGTSNEVEITNGANSIQIGLPNDVTIGGDLTISGGDIDLTGAATDIDLVDNNASALSFDASGKAGILEIVTTDGSEVVNMSGGLNVVGAVSASSIAIDGALPVSEGGSGVTSLADKAVLISQDSGTDAIGALALTGNGEIIVGGTNGPAVEAAADVAGTGLDASVGDGTLALDVAAAQTSMTSIINSSLGKIGTAADQEYITFGSSNEVNTHINNTERLSVTAAGVDVTGALTVSSDVTVEGNLDVNGTLTSVDSNNLQIKDQFILAASGSNNHDGGIIVNTAAAGSGSAFAWDNSAVRWGISGADETAKNATTYTPRQYVVSVSGSATSPSGNPSDFGASTATRAGMMHVNTSNGEIWIYS